MTTADLVKLLERWRDMPSFPSSGEGLVSTSEDIAEQDVWTAEYVRLVEDTERAITEANIDAETIKDLRDRLDDICETCQERCKHRKETT